MSVSFPIGVTIAWILARTKIPFSHTLEFMFWIAYMVPALPTTIAWITLLDPDIGMINVALKKIFLLDQGPFNIFTVPGIVWANLMGHGIAIKVIRSPCQSNRPIPRIVIRTVLLMLAPMQGSSRSRRVKWKANAGRSK